MRTSLMSEVLLNRRASIRVDAKYVLGFGVTDRIPKQLPALPWATQPAHHTMRQCLFIIKGSSALRSCTIFRDVTTVLCFSLPQVILSPCFLSPPI